MATVKTRLVAQRDWLTNIITDIETGADYHNGGGIEASALLELVNDQLEGLDAPYWGEETPHHFFGHADWRSDVENHNTNSSYSDWVNELLGQIQGELEELEAQFEATGSADGHLEGEIDELRDILRPKC